MKTLFSFLLFLAFTSSAIAADLDVLSLLKRDIGEAIEIQSDKEIRYCPDNTCEIFRSSKPHPDFPSFVYLYLFHRSSFIQLDMQFGSKIPFRKAAIEEAQVRSKLTSYSPGDRVDPEELIDIIKESLEIQTCFGRFDEGSFCFSCDGEKTICE